MGVMGITWLQGDEGGARLAMGRGFMLCVNYYVMINWVIAFLNA